VLDVSKQYLDIGLAATFGGKMGVGILSDPYTSRLSRATSKKFDLETLCPYFGTISRLIF
jgi:hypothetical protein